MTTNRFTANLVKYYTTATTSSFPQTWIVSQNTTANTYATLLGGGGGQSTTAITVYDPDVNDDGTGVYLSHQSGWSNLKVLPDAQDKYVGKIGRIQIEPGYDCTIMLPNGKILRVEEDGKISFEDTIIDDYRKVKIPTDNKPCLVEFPNGLTFHVDEHGEYFASGIHYGNRGEIDARDLRSGINRILMDGMVFDKDSKIANMRIERDPNSPFTALNYVIMMPDGTLLTVAPDGSFRLDDSNAKVIYRSRRVREWNPFMHVSDMMEQFIEDAGKYGVRQSEFLDMPIEVFINWLIFKAAEADGETPPVADIGRNSRLRRFTQPTCLHCGELISHEFQRRGIAFCSGAHLDAFVALNHIDATVPRLITSP